MQFTTMTERMWWSNTINTHLSIGMLNTGYYINTSKIPIQKVIFELCTDQKRNKTAPMIFPVKQLCIIPPVSAYKKSGSMYELP